MMEFYNNYKSITVSGGTYPNIYVVDDFGRELNRTVSTTLAITIGSHGAKTILTIKSIAKRSQNKIYKVNYFRPVMITDSSRDYNFPQSSVMDAIFSVLIFDNLKAGDVFIANLEIIDNNNSIVTEELCREMLKNLIMLGVIVIVPAGNKNEKILDIDLADIGDIIVVGSICQDNITRKFSTKNRYNDRLTCFAEDKISLDIGNFEETSAATAQIAGFVMLMQKYAKSKGRFLKPGEIKSILKTCGDKISISPYDTSLVNNVPNWLKVKDAINRVLTPDSR